MIPRAPRSTPTSRQSSASNPTGTPAAKQRLRDVYRGLGAFLKEAGQAIAVSQDPQDLTRVVMQQPGDCDQLDTYTFPVRQPLYTSVMEDPAYLDQVAGGPVKGTPYYTDTQGSPGYPLLSGENVLGGSGVDTSGYQGTGTSPDGVTLGSSGGVTTYYDPGTGTYYKMATDGSAGFYAYDTLTHTFTQVTAPHNSSGVSAPGPLPYVAGVQTNPGSGQAQAPHGGLPAAVQPNRDNMTVVGTAPNGQALGWTTITISGVVHTRWLGLYTDGTHYYAWDDTDHYGGWFTWDGTKFVSADPPVILIPQTGGAPSPFTNKPAVASITHDTYPDQTDPTTGLVTQYGNPAAPNGFETAPTHPEREHGSGIAIHRLAGLGLSLARKLISGISIHGGPHPYNDVVAPGARVDRDESTVYLDQEQQHVAKGSRTVPLKGGDPVRPTIKPTLTAVSSGGTMEPGVDHSYFLVYRKTLSGETDQSESELGPEAVKTSTSTGTGTGKNGSIRVQAAAAPADVVGQAIYRTSVNHGHRPVLAYEQNDNLAIDWTDTKGETPFKRALLSLPRGGEYPQKKGPVEVSNGLIMALFDLNLISTTLASGSLTQIPLTNKVWGSASLTLDGSGKVITPLTGVYEISCEAKLSWAATHTVDLNLEVENDTDPTENTWDPFSQVQNLSTDLWTLRATGPIRATAGDLIQIRIAQNAGADAFINPMHLAIKYLGLVPA